MSEMTGGQYIVEDMMSLRQSLVDVYTLFEYIDVKQVDPFAGLDSLQFEDWTMPI